MSWRRREAARDRAEAGEGATDGEWVRALRIDALVDGVGQTVTMPSGKRVAVFRYGNKISALSNACPSERPAW